MATHMKTTIEIADALLAAAKQLATGEGATLRSLVEEGLRELLERRGQPGTRFQLPRASFSGNGLQEGLTEGDWNAIRARLYEGRGG